MIDEAENYQIINGKKMRRGFTTGATAAAAATAAVKALCTGVAPKQILIIVNKNLKQSFKIEAISFFKDEVSCTIIKDAGDDPDVTNGLEIIACCKKISHGQDIKIFGGEGVGIVTRRGFKIEVGKPAINPVPLAMIEQNVRDVLKDYPNFGTINITISVPKGAEVAKKTFNPLLGIEGGISILGTTGIVEPMSQKAFIDSIKLVIDGRKEIDPKKIILSFGNYGIEFAKSLGVMPCDVVKCSNFIGEALDYIKYCNFKELIIIGHIGKLIKVAGGIMDTHSKIADCRMEILCAYSAIAGVKSTDCKKIMNCVTTEEALLLLRELKIEDEVVDEIAKRVLYHIKRRSDEKTNIKIIIFSDAWKVLKTYEP